MTIRFLTGIAGLDFSYAPGDVIDASKLSPRTVSDLISAKYAEPVQEQVRQATTRPAEKAINRRKREITHAYTRQPQGPSTLDQR